MTIDSKCPHVWININNFMPDKNDQYMCTIQHTRCSITVKWLDVFYYDTEQKTWTKNNPLWGIEENSYLTEDTYITHWMHLPEFSNE